MCNNASLTVWQWKNWSLEPEISSTIGDCLPACLMVCMFVCLFVFKTRFTAPEANSFLSSRPQNQSEWLVSSLSVVPISHQYVILLLVGIVDRVHSRLIEAHTAAFIMTKTRQQGKASHSSAQFHYNLLWRCVLSLTPASCVLSAPVGKGYWLVLCVNSTQLISEQWEKA